MENSIKSVSTINPAITENMEWSIVKACTPVINLKVGVPFDHDASVHFYTVDLQTLWETFQAKNNCWSTPDSTALAQVLYQSYNTLFE